MASPTYRPGSLEQWQVRPVVAMAVLHENPQQPKATGVARCLGLPGSMQPGVRIGPKDRGPRSRYVACSTFGARGLSKYMGELGWVNG